MTVQWITPILGTAAWEGNQMAGADAVVDVRSLRDGSGNSPALLTEKISEIETHLRAGRRTVVCCDHGMSRSNALAAAALAQVDGGGFRRAFERVLEATGERAIKVDLLGEIRAVLGETEPEASHPDERCVLVVGGEGFIAEAVREALMRHGLESSVAGTRSAPAQLEQIARSSGAHSLIFLARPLAPNSNEGLGQLLSELRGALEVCRTGALGLVFLSSHQVYDGYHGSELHPDEEMATCPDSTLGEALSLGEQMIAHHGNRFGMETLVVRTCVLYAAGDSRPGFLRTFVQQAVSGEEITTHRYRNGPPLVDLLHVRDFAAGLALAVRQRLTGRLHLASSQGITTAALAQTIARLAGTNSPVRCVDLPGKVANVILDCARARIALGWAPEVALECGLSELIAGQRLAGKINGDVKS